MVDGLLTHDDGKTRCAWAGNDLQYIAYHDDEWGRPVYDDVRLFEKLSLEGFQAGLSWLTILRKRENFRRAFADFDIETVARFGAKDVDRLVNDAGIIRHRGKIEATINNAQKTCDLIDSGVRLSEYLWSFKPPREDRHAIFDYATLSGITQTPESAALSKDLKKRGFKFVGPTTMYALMQAMGIVNDHIEGCYCR